MSKNKITAEDVRNIRRSADELMVLSARLFGHPLGLETHRIIAGNARDSAEKIERKLKL